MTRELMLKLEAMATTREYREEIVPALIEMKQENLEALASDHEDKVSAFLRGRIAILTELITIEDNLKKRQTEVALREKRINTTRPTGSLVYVDTGA